MQNRENIIEECFSGNLALQKAWRKSMWCSLKDSDLSPAQLSLLFIIENHQPVSGKDISAKMQISKSAVTQMLDVLHENGYTQRTVDDKDRRVIYINLSKSGTQRLNVLHEARRKQFIEATKTLSDEELKTMTAIQNKMINQIEG